MWEQLFILKDCALLIEIDKSSGKASSWLGLGSPNQSKESSKFVRNGYVHFITIDLSGIFSNCIDKSISLFCTIDRSTLPIWKYVVHQSGYCDGNDFVRIKSKSLVKDENPINWMREYGYGLPKSKLGGKPSYLQEEIKNQYSFLLQINWEDLIFEANQIIGKQFNVISEAFMGGNVYLFGAINSETKEIDFDKIFIYHQYS